MTTDRRYLNISEMAAMFGLARGTVRKRLKAAGLTPVKTERNAGRYDMHRAGPALFTEGGP